MHKIVERFSFLVGQSKRGSEGANRMRVGSPPQPALERPDGVAGQAGAFGKLVLCQSCGFP
jgi:hypothetical protein